MRRIAFITFLLFLPGCGTMIELAKIVRDDPVKIQYIMTPDPELDKDKAEKVQDVALMVSLSAGRRNFIVSLDGENRGKFCAEPPPDVATDILNLVESAYSVGGKSATADVDVGIRAQQRDLHASTAVILAKRTALLDIFRTGTFALCQYRLNGFIKDTELKNLFERLITEVTGSMKQDPSPNPMTAQELKELFEKVVIGVVSSKQEAANSKK